MIIMSSLVETDFLLQKKKRNSLLPKVRINDIKKLSQNEIVL